MTTPHLSVLALVLAVAAALTGCSGEDDSATVSPRGNWSVGEARAFEGFALFWASEDYAEAPLSAINRADYLSAERPGRTVVEDSVSFLYGSCVLPESGEGGCAAPYQIVIRSACSMVGLVLPERFERQFHYGRCHGRRLPERRSADALDAGRDYYHFWT